jgi:predicted secreted Zn-dependent protease
MSSNLENHEEFVKVKFHYFSLNPGTRAELQ